MKASIHTLAALIALALSPFSVAAEGGYEQLGERFILPSPDLAKLALEDSKAEGLPYRYGIQIGFDALQVRGKRASHGQWSRLDDGRLSLRWELASPGAKSLDFHFSTLKLPASAELIIRGEGKDNERIIKAADLAGDAFWSPYVAGDVATLEVRVNPRERAKVDVQLAHVTHGYRGLFEEARDLSKSGSCNVDVVCSAGTGWGDQIDSVGQYTFSQSGSSYVCTGTLLGNTGNTTTPYFLTANHCVSTATVASTVVVYWNYESSTCRTPGSTASGTPISKTVATHSQSGASLTATSATSDFALLRLSTDVPTGANAFFSGWDATGTAPTSAAGIHHPAGHEKRISIEDQALTISAYGGGSGTTHWRVNDWDQGTTEGGSSGSGLWNQSKRLVGQLHGGSAACGNNLSDYYGRLSVSWNGGGTAATRLKDWLDPGNTGTTSFAGYRTGTTPPPPTGATFENNTDFAILDKKTINSPIVVSGRTGNAPSTLKVYVNILHTYRGDLKVDLVAPDGTLYNIHNRTGGSADNLTGTYTINASSEVANGTWNLRVYDGASGDTGTLDKWNLQF